MEAIDRCRCGRWKESHQLRCLTCRDEWFRSALLAKQDEVPLPPLPGYSDRSELEASEAHRIEMLLSGHEFPAEGPDTDADVTEE